MEPFIGQIQAFGFNFAPRGWAKCEGQLLSISSNTALFSLLGTMYGGDGRTTFGLPDLRGRGPIGAGNGPGLSSRALASKGGLESTSIGQANLPPLAVMASSGNATQNAATANSSLATPGTTAGRVFTATQGYNTTAPNIPLNAGPSMKGGTSAAMNNMQPFLTLNYCIALFGIYPSRS